jgi:hypothetical protein
MSVQSHLAPPLQIANHLKLIRINDYRRAASLVRLREERSRRRQLAI